MWIKVASLVVLLINSVLCDDEDAAAKVEQVPAENSTISYIKYTNNGLFAPPGANLTNYQPAPTLGHQLMPQCGGTFRNLQNLIESPKFISPRPICNLRCEYQIVSPYICENEFHVQFLDFAIDSSPSCENDRVIINYSEVMCGKIIGVKKFRTNSGVLNITFSSRFWDLRQGKGFRLLVTRLPCVDDANENQTEIESLEPNAPADVDDEHRCFHVNSSYAVSNPSYGQGHPIYGVPAIYNRTSVAERQDVPVLPLPQPQPPFNGPDQPVVPIFPPIPPILPPQFLPQCCRNSYNQQRFLMLSQGFPARAVRNNDCIFVIQRSSPNVCRLRIVFKYFLLDDPQAGQFGCVNNFIEIDGQRMCGCKTNFVYETQWGFEPKVIRMRTVPGSYANAQGFVFDVVQEPCPFKIQDGYQNGYKTGASKQIKSEKFLLHPLLNNGQGQEIPRDYPTLQLHPALRQFKSDVAEKFQGKFLQPEPNYINNVCVMNHLKLFQLTLETLGIFKQYCLPFY